MLGARAREHVDVAHLILQLRLVHLLDLSAGDRRLSIADVQHFSDRRGRDFVIARNHGDANAAAMTFLDRLDGLLARRVEQADQAKEDEISRQVGGSEAARLQAGILEPSKRQPRPALAGGGVAGAPKVGPTDPLPAPPRALLSGAS